jgi:hypothetical protein
VLRGPIGLSLRRKSHRGGAASAAGRCGPANALLGDHGNKKGSPPKKSGLRVQAQRTLVFKELAGNPAPRGKSWQPSQPSSLNGLMSRHRAVVRLPT